MRLCVFSQVMFYWPHLQFSISKYQTDETLILRVHGTVSGVTAAQAYAKLRNSSKRPEWDFMCK